jgi:3-hydroxyisobutyrate dehydrogenase
MAKITVLGLGAMGTRMTANLIKAGHALTVWNRTPEAAVNLVTAGAHRAGTPKAAATRADFVLAMLRDDEASRAVWLDPEDGALAGMRPEALAIESSTLTPAWIKELGAAFGVRNRLLLEAPVSGTRPHAEAGQLLFFAGGTEAALDCARPVLEAMGSDIRHTGPLGTGALAKLTTNALLGVQVAALAELIGMLRAADTEPGRILAAVSGASAWSPVADYLASTMLTGDFAPMFPIDLIEKDFGYIIRLR